MYRLVVSDIDGTLIGKDEILSDEAVALVQALHAKGIKFTVATGRVEEMAESYVKKLGIQVPYIATNGATILGNGHLYQRLQIPAAPLRAFINHADALGLTIIYTIEGKEFVWTVNEHIRKQQSRFNRYFNVHQFSDDEWNSLYIDKLSLMSEKDDASFSILEKECMALSGPFGFTRYMDRSIEVVHKDATKAKAVQTLSKILDIPLTQVLFIGDHQNDLEVMDVVGMGVAVGNSIAELKAKADYVCANSIFFGVQEAIEKFVLSEQ